MKPFIFIFLFLSSQIQASTVEEKIYILGGDLTTNNGENFPYLTFNDSNLFTINNPIIELSVNDVLDLWIINFDSVPHSFEIKGILNNIPIISAGDSIQVSHQFTSSGVFIYFDPVNYPQNSYTGLGGMINVSDVTQNKFFWNLKTHQSNWNTSILAGNTPNWNTYNPNYYTINGNSFPEINDDPSARITGVIGDTLLLYISNTGQSTHSLHFHGYHAEIKYSSKDFNHVGRIKDTFPIYSMESLILQIVPDKSGEYPIHDHNLVATTGNGLYPNGMLTTILIAP